jgi:hypothetical protein
MQVLLWLTWFLALLGNGEFTAETQRILSFGQQPDKARETLGVSAVSSLLVAAQPPGV